ncbi:MAG: stealth family protein [Marinilabiliaceae bacterium]|nr:stealth family protein [Marinilabiliaceae bacterium]
MKIDLVYIWVDGSDQNWLTKKNEALEKIGKPITHLYATDNRWRDNNELKYSLRSAEKYAPWINHIFIVTDNQIPKWLNINNPKITIIDHKQIIPMDKLPLFNANAIEMFLWKIPDLSEYFLYANDDMFFGKPLNPDFFFDRNGNPIVIMKQRNRSFKNLDDFSNVTSRLFMVKSARTIKFAYKKLGIKFNLAFKHAIEPIRKSYMEENFKELENNIYNTTITAFRDVNNIQRIIMPLFDNAKKRNTIVLNWHTGNKRIVYKSEKDNKVRRLFLYLKWIFSLIIGIIKYDCYDKQWFLVKFIKKHKPSLFAINDFSKNKTTFKMAEKLMINLFPNKSEYEK